MHKRVNPQFPNALISPKTNLTRHISSIITSLAIDVTSPKQIKFITPLWRVQWANLHRIASALCDYSAICISSHRVSGNYFYIKKCRKHGSPIWKPSPPTEIAPFITPSRIESILRQKQTIILQATLTRKRTQSFRKRHSHSPHTGIALSLCTFARCIWSIIRSASHLFYMLCDSHERNCTYIDIEPTDHPILIRCACLLI